MPAVDPMLLATITLRDGRLELAIGLHAVNNVLLALVANYEGSALMTESVFTAREFDPVYLSFSCRRSSPRLCGSIIVPAFLGGLGGSVPVVGAGIGGTGRCWLRIRRFARPV